MNTVEIDSKDFLKQLSSNDHFGSSDVVTIVRGDLDLSTFGKDIKNIIKCWFIGKAIKLNQNMRFAGCIFDGESVSVEIFPKADSQIYFGECRCANNGKIDLLFDSHRNSPCLLAEIYLGSGNNSRFFMTVNHYICFISQSKFELLRIKGGSVEDDRSVRSIHVVSCKVNTIEFDNTVGKEMFHIEGCSIDLVQFRGLESQNQLNVIGKNVGVGTRHVDNIELLSIGESTIHLSCLKVENLRLNNIKTSGTLVLRDIVCGKKVEIEDCDFDNTRFYGVDMSSCEISVCRSSFDKMYLATVFWPEDSLKWVQSDGWIAYQERSFRFTEEMVKNANTEILGKEEEDSKRFERLKNETRRQWFRQLKSNYIAQNDHVNAIAFYEKEMCELRKHASTWDKIPLFFMRHTSCFGTSWVRSGVFLIGVLVLFGTIENVVKGELCVFSNAKCEWPDLRRVGEFLSCLSGLILFESVNEKSSDWLHVTRVFGRFAVGFVLYNTIVSFRKFNRKF